MFQVMPKAPSQRGLSAKLTGGVIQIIGVSRYHRFSLFTFHSSLLSRLWLSIIARIARNSQGL